MINPMNAYDMAKMHQQDLLLEAEEWRQARQVRWTGPVHAVLTKLLVALGKALTRVTEQPAVHDGRSGEIA